MSPTSLLPNHPSHATNRSVSLLPNHPSHATNRSLSPPATRTHEFASSDASVSRNPVRDVPRDVPTEWPSC
jgi:hypothetical protein